MSGADTFGQQDSGMDPSTLVDDDVEMEEPAEMTIKRAREALGDQGWNPKPLDSSMVTGDAALPPDAQHLHQAPEPFGLTFPEEIPPLFMRHRFDSLVSSKRLAWRFR